MPVNSRAKGKRGELNCAQFLRDHGVAARRGQQYSGGADSADIVHDIPGVHIECKFTERLRLYEALEQAKTDCRDGDIPAVFHRANSKPWVVILDGADFLSLVRSSMRTDSPIYGSPKLKEVVVDAAQSGQITHREADEIFEEYGLRSA